MHQNNCQQLFCVYLIEFVALMFRYSGVGRDDDSLFNLEISVGREKEA